MESYKKRVIAFPEKQQSSFLFGVRGSGKTMLLKQRFPDALYIDLLDRAVYQAHLANPSLFYREVNAFKKDGMVIVDEIQKIPDLLNEVHRLIEESSMIESSKRQFVLTGSSTRKLNKAGENLLAGRAFKRILHPFVPEELTKDFNLNNLNTALRYGLLPVVWASADRGDALKSYVQMYLKEEIEAEAFVRNLAPFARFLEVAGLYHGQVVNMNAIARECGISRQAVQSFFSVLEDTMLGFFLPAYVPRLKLKEQKHSKFYLTDPGLARALKNNFGPVTQEEKGFLFEGLVAQILRAYKDYTEHSGNPLCESISYWSPSDAKKTEVDFILKTNKGLVAMEVKSKSHISSTKDYKGLVAIDKLPEVKKRIVIYTGETLGKTEEGIEIWPFDFFCKVLKGGDIFEDSSGLYVPSSQMRKQNTNQPPVFDVSNEDIGSHPLSPSRLQIPPPESGEDFENMCLDLYKAEFGNQTQIHGRKGQSQWGVDIFVPDKHIGIQCKKRDINGQITKKELEEEVKKAKGFQPPLKRFILATTCKRDAKIQKEARLISEKHKKDNLFFVEIASWDDIKLLFDKYIPIYNKYYNKGNAVSEPQSQRNDLTPPLIKEIKSESHNSELNRIRELIKNQKPKTALDLLNDFKKEQWNTLDDKTKYRVLHNMGYAKIRMNQIPEGDNFLIKALQYNQEDEDALINCASAWFRKGEIKKAKQHIHKAKTLNPQNEFVYILEIQILNYEGTPLTGIVRHIPDDLKNNPRLALVLCDISNQKGSNKEFLKWLNIFDKNRPQDDTESASDYAALALKNILKKESVLTASRVPGELKPKIEKIISIYKKLLKDRKNQEIISFRPRWYNNYALALFYNGQHTEAIKQLEEAVEKCPSDTYLEDLGRMYVKKGGGKKAVSVFEKLKNPPTDIKCTLLHLYFQTCGFEKACQFFNKTVEDKTISEKDRLEIKRAWVGVLLDHKEMERAEKELNTFFEQDRESVKTLIFKSHIEEHKEHFKEQKQYLRQAWDIYQNNKHTAHFMDKPLLANELHYAKMYDLCEALWEDIIGQNLHHPGIRYLLHTYFENGKNKKTIELAQKLCKSFPNESYPVETLFHTYNEMGDRKSAIKQYEDFVGRTGDIPVQVDLIHTYVLNNLWDKAKKLLSNTDYDIHQLSPDRINKLSISYMKTGMTEKSLKTQYQGIKLHPKDLSLKSLYANLMTLFQPQTKNHPLFQKKEVKLDTFVKIKETLSGDVIEIIIEEDADIYTPGHPLVKKLLGKNRGAIVSLNDKQYQVVDIQSKYVYKFQQIFKNVELEDPLQKELKQFSIPENPSKEDIEKIQKSMMPNALKQQENFDKALKYYTGGQVTIGFVSHVTGQHPVEIINTLIDSKEHKWLSSMTGSQSPTNNHPELKNTPSIVMDISSLLTLHWLKMETYLASSTFPLYVCQSTVDSLNQWILKMEPHLMLSTGFDNKGKLMRHFIPAEDIRQNTEFFNSIKDWCQKHCQMAVLPVDFEMSRKEKLRLSKLLGEEFLNSAFVLHQQKNKVLLTEDGVWAGFAAREFSTPGMRCWDLICYFEKEAVMEKKQSIKFKAELIKLNQTYISIDHQILMHLLKEAEYQVTDIRFQRGLFFLSSASSLTGAIGVSADFLRELYQELVVLPFHKREITKEVLNQLCRGRQESPQYIAQQLNHLVKIKTRLLPLLQADILKGIKEWWKWKVYE